jgi:hypothetical protein
MIDRDIFFKQKLGHQRLMADSLSLFLISLLSWLSCLTRLAGVQ